MCIEQPVRLPHRLAVRVKEKNPTGMQFLHMKICFSYCRSKILVFLSPKGVFSRKLEKPVQPTHIGAIEYGVLC